MLTLEVVDLNDVPLPDPKVSISPFGDYSVVGNIITIKNHPNYGEIILEWTSAIYGTTCSKVKVFQLERFQNKVEKVKMPVGDVEIQIVDIKANPLPGLTVKFGNIKKITDATGRVIFEQVPLEYKGGGIKYELGIYYEGLIIYSTSINVAISEKFRIRQITVPLTELEIYVTDLRKQPLPFAKILISLNDKNRLEMFSTTSIDGRAKISRILIGKEYNINAEYKGFKGYVKIKVSSSQNVGIQLPIYKEYFGYPVGSLLGFIIESFKVIGPTLIAFIIGYLLK